MKKENRYCTICGKECEYVILQKEDAKFVARDSSHVEARGSSHVEAMDSSHVVARDSSHVEAMGSSHVEAMDSSHVVARDSSHVEARGSSHVEARGSSHVEAMGSSHVVAWDSSHVEARDSSHVVAWGSSHVEGQSPYATTTIKSEYSKVSGGTIIGNQIIPAKQWLEKCGVKVSTRGYCVLYKSVKKDYTTRNGVTFKPNTYHKADDWDAASTDECGKGIHYSPTIAQARQFRDEVDGHYIACRVKVSDMADLPAFAEYPDKIRAKGGYALFEVDKDEKRIKKAGK